MLYQPKANTQYNYDQNSDVQTGTMRMAIETIEGEYKILSVSNCTDPIFCMALEEKLGAIKAPGSIIPLGAAAALPLQTSPEAQN